MPPPLHQFSLCQAGLKKKMAQCIANADNSFSSFAPARRDVRGNVCEEGKLGTDIWPMVANMASRCFTPICEECVCVYCIYIYAYTVRYTVYGIPYQIIRTKCEYGDLWPHRYPQFKENTSTCVSLLLFYLFVGQISTSSFFSFFSDIYSVRWCKCAGFNYD